MRWVDFLRIILNLRGVIVIDAGGGTAIIRFLKVNIVNSQRSNFYVIGARVQ